MLTPKLDRNRLYSVRPIHLHEQAYELQRRARDNEQFFGEQIEAYELYSVSIWMLDLAKGGALPLRAKERDIILRVMNRQREKFPHWRASVLRWRVRLTHSFGMLSCATAKKPPKRHA
jgi:hypothetical protein